MSRRRAKSGTRSSKRRRRHGAGADPRQGLPRGPLPRRAAVDRLDHLREGRPVRPRHGRDPLRAGHQPDDRTGRSERERLGPDPAHHQRDRRARPRYPRLHGPRTSSSSTRPTATRCRSRTRSTVPARTPRTPPTSPRHGRHAVRGRRLLEPARSNPSSRVSTSAKTSRADGASLTAKLAVPGALGTQANISQGQSRTPQSRSLPPNDPAESVHGRTIRNQPRGVPAGVDHRTRQGDHPDPAVPAGRPGYFVCHGGEGSPTSRSSSRATASRST